jgi:hypothetical protein
MGDLIAILVYNQLPPQMPLIVIYESEQDRKEEVRCKKNGICMLSLDNLSSIQAFLRMASFGLAVRFKRNGFEFSACTLGV